VHIGSHLRQRLLRLSPPLTRDLAVRRDLRVPMPDGVELLADLWSPRTGGELLPTMLIRGPYGRRGLMSGSQANVLAERGYQVLAQSVRGTFGSGGVFDPFRNEREDGLATLDWVIKQPWFGGSIVLSGASYLGYTQWAVADSVPPEVKAMIPQSTESALSLEFLRGDGFSLETPFAWGVTIAGQGRRLPLLRALLQTRKTRRALFTLPLERADEAAIGRRDDYLQDILVHNAEASRWAGIDHRERVRETKIPVSSIGGWYDILLPGQIRDFHFLQEAGLSARLTIGPWTHFSGDGTGTLEAVEFGLAYARGEKPAERPPVRLYVMGEEAWHEFESWPPRAYVPRRFHLQPGGGLTDEQLPGQSAPDRYRYDPMNPTPAVGGARMGGGGRANNTTLEARPDVLTYTTTALDEDVDVIGDVSAEIWFRSSVSYADVFVRLCDVDLRGRSYNICDGLVTLTGADEIRCAIVTLWPTAYRFKRGHRIRVQVSSGSFPRYARNPGNGEPAGTATTLFVADQAVYHDPAYPSAILLPVREP